MDSIFAFITIISSTTNAMVAFFLAYRLFKEKNASYLKKQFRNFFITFAIYFTLINIIVNALLDDPYFFFVSVEAAHFILVLSLAFLYSAFAWIEKEKETRTAFWLFLILGLMITVAGLVNINPEITSLDAPNVYFNHVLIFIPKIVLLGFGFLYPAFRFIQKAILSKEKYLKQKYLLFSASFIFWLIGGALHSQYETPALFLLGDIILFAGFIMAGIILLENEDNKKAPN